VGKKIKQLPKYEQEQQNVDSNLEEFDKGSIHIKKLDINFKTKSQEELWNLIETNQIVICSGEAGTGKSHISLLKALDLMRGNSKKYKKIYITTPAVEADGEKLGYLPGDVNDKLGPYMYSSIYLLKKILGDVKVNRMIERKHIEILALSYLRGVNIDNAILICEESQNLTIKTLKTLLTRIGENAKFILNGDLSQSDRVKNHKDSGLFFAIDKLKDISDIGIFQFKENDIVRNPIITLILKAFNENSN